MPRFLIILMALIAISLSSPASATTFTFDNPLTGWSVDRYAPHSFASQESFMGDNRLKIEIDAADGQNNRPASFSSAFYNTQGMKMTNDAGTVGLSIDLWIDAATFASTERHFGLWGVAHDISSTISAYPILEFANGGFRGWDSAGFWEDYGAAGVTGDEWVTMSFELDTVADTFSYMLNGTFLGSVSAMGSQEIVETILQGYNTLDGRNYTIYADNLTSQTTPVPLPAGALLLLTALGGFLAVRKT